MSITSEKLKGVIRTLETQLPDNPEIVMIQGTPFPWYRESQYCDSPGCFAGAYACALAYLGDDRAFRTSGAWEHYGTQYDDAVWLEEENKWVDNYGYETDENDDITNQEEADEVINRWCEQEFEHYMSVGDEDYQEGAQAMAEDLGFECTDDLVAWAAENPYLWGNCRGDLMFSSADAFDPEKGRRSMKLKEVVDHLKKVCARLEERERQAKPA